MSRSIVEAATGASERYLKAAAEVREQDPKFCHICGSIGWLLMNRAVFVEMLSEMEHDDPDRAEVEENLAIVDSQELPVHTSAEPEAP